MEHNVISLNIENIITIGLIAAITGVVFVGILGSLKGRLGQ